MSRNGESQLDAELGIVKKETQGSRYRKLTTRKLGFET